MAPDARIEKDAVARINTLGLLGEQYLEITPGKETIFVASGEEMEGKNPVNVGQQMESVADFMKSASSIAKKIEQGEGTLGKFISDDAVYNDLTTIFGRLARGEGTIGLFLTDDEVYNNLEDFTADIKAHPWKLLKKGKEKEIEKSSRRR